MAYTVSKQAPFNPELPDLTNPTKTENQVPATQSG
jgi:hypothetical protein